MYHHLLHWFRPRFVPTAALIEVMEVAMMEALDHILKSALLGQIVTSEPSTFNSNPDHQRAWRCCVLCMA